MRSQSSGCQSVRVPTPKADPGGAIAGGLQQSVSFLSLGQVGHLGGSFCTDHHAISPQNATNRTALIANPELKVIAPLRLQGALLRACYPKQANTELLWSGAVV